MNLTPRNILILKIIIEEFLKTGEVFGSKALLNKYDIGVSPATVRGDMAKLEKMHLLYQPYNSAGRLPTTPGLRIYIDYLMKETPSYLLNSDNININNDIKNFSDFIYNTTSTLSKNTKEISFFIIPNENIINYSGIKDFLNNNKKNITDVEKAILVIKMIEDKNRFINYINKLNLNPGINLFIGEENILNDLKEFSLIIKPIYINNTKAYIGLIGNIRQNYSYNIAALKGII